MLTDHLVFSPKYRCRILIGEVAKETEKIIQDICKELKIEIIDMAVNKDHAHLFFKYPPKYSVSYIAQKIKGVSSKKLRERFPHLRKWCPSSLWAPSCFRGTDSSSSLQIADAIWRFHGSVGHGQDVVEKYIKTQKYSTY